MIKQSTNNCALLLGLFLCRQAPGAAARGSQTIFRVVLDVERE